MLFPVPTFRKLVMTVTLFNESVPPMWLGSMVPTRVVLQWVLAKKLVRRLAKERVWSFLVRTVMVSRSTETCLFVATSTLTLCLGGPELTSSVRLTRLLAALFTVEIIMVIPPFPPLALIMCPVICPTDLALVIDELLHPRMTRVIVASPPPLQRPARLTPHVNVMTTKAVVPIL